MTKSAINYKLFLLFFSSSGEDQPGISLREKFLKKSGGSKEEKGQSREEKKEKKDKLSAKKIRDRHR